MSSVFVFQFFHGMTKLASHDLTTAYFSRVILGASESNHDEYEWKYYQKT